MKISKQQLIEMSACEFCLNRFIAQTGGTDEPVEVVSLIGGENTYSDLLWLAGKTLPKEKIVRFATDCAQISIEKLKLGSDYSLLSAFFNMDRATDAACAARVAYTVADAADAACDAAAVCATDEVNELLVKLFTEEESK